jgi:hypothetical protein
MVFCFSSRRGRGHARRLETCSECIDGSSTFDQDDDGCEDERADTEAAYDGAIYLAAVGEEEGCSTPTEEAGALGSLEPSLDRHEHILPERWNAAFGFSRKNSAFHGPSVLLSK